MGAPVGWPPSAPARPAWRRSLTTTVRAFLGRWQRQRRCRSHRPPPRPPGAPVGGFPRPGDRRADDGAGHGAHRGARFPEAARPTRPRTRLVRRHTRGTRIKAGLPASPTGCTRNGRDPAAAASGRAVDTHRHRESAAAPRWARVAPGRGRRLRHTTCQSQAGQGHRRQPGQADARLGSVHDRASSLEAHSFYEQR